MPNFVRFSIPRTFVFNFGQFFSLPILSNSVPEEMRKVKTSFRGPVSSAQSIECLATGLRWLSKGRMHWSRMLQMASKTELDVEKIKIAKESTDWMASTKSYPHHWVTQWDSHRLCALPAPLFLHWEDNTSYSSSEQHKHFSQLITTGVGFCFFPFLLTVEPRTPWMLSFPELHPSPSFSNAWCTL